ncbi:hypothetical protein MASR2M17_03100 [Aminivibrio sp.]
MGTYALRTLHRETGLRAARTEAALVSTQILQRDRHGNVMNTLALLGGALERFATEIRHLQRTEVMEALEPFGSRQKGSSAMPHRETHPLRKNLRNEQAFAGVRPDSHGEYGPVA